MAPCWSSHILTTTLSQSICNSCSYCPEYSVPRHLSGSLHLVEIFASTNILPLWPLSLFYFFFFVLILSDAHFFSLFFSLLFPEPTLHQGEKNGLGWRKKQLYILEKEGNSQYSKECWWGSRWNQAAEQRRVETVMPAWSRSRRGAWEQGEDNTCFGWGERRKKCWWPGGGKLRIPPGRSAQDAVLPQSANSKGFWMKVSDISAWRGVELFDTNCSVFRA